MNYTQRSDILALHDAFLARRPEVFREFGGLDPGSFNWQPGEGRWSVAQCLAHLCEVGQHWADHLSPILFSAMQKGVHHRKVHVPGPIGRRAIGSMKNVDRRLSAPKLFRPHHGSDFDLRDTLRNFDAVGESWEATLRRACLLDLSAIRVGSPAAAWFRMPLGTWLMALSAHEDRHLDQARRVMAEPEFPG